MRITKGHLGKDMPDVDLNRAERWIEQNVLEFKTGEREAGFAYE